MKYLCLLVVTTFMALSPTHADTAYPHARSKSQAEGQYLSSFWEKAQVSQAFIEAFYDSAAFLAVVNSSASVGSANVSSNEIKVTANHPSAALVKAN